MSLQPPQVDAAPAQQHWLNRLLLDGLQRKNRSFFLNYICRIKCLIPVIIYFIRDKEAALDQMFTVHSFKNRNNKQTTFKG
jgi:hypothetical protein